MPILLSKIPLVVRLAWNRTAESKADVPDVKEFLTFLKDEVTAREEAGTNFVTTHPKDERVPRKKDPDDRIKDNRHRGSANALVGAVARSCLFCSGEHYTNHCNDCDKLPITERWEKIKKAKACFLCFSVGHHTKDCNAQFKVKKCSKCSSQHNVLLCPKDSSGNESKINQSTAIVPAQVSVDSSTKVMVYQTVVVEAKGTRCAARVRVLLDTGAGRSFIKSSLSRRLRCQHIGNESLELGTFGGGTSQISNARVVQVLLRPLGSDEEISVPVIEANRLCSSIPVPEVKEFKSKLDSLGIRLSDNQSVDVDPEIQLVLGLDLLPAIFMPVSRRIDAALYAHRTRLGWTLWGNKRVPVRNGSSTGHNCASVLFVGSKVVPDGDAVKSLWDLESVGIMPDELKNSEHPVLSQFREDVKLRDTRYEVSLPWKEGRELTCSNFKAAESRYMSLERKLMQNPRSYNAYREVFRTYLDGDIIELVPVEELKWGKFSR